MPDNFSFSAPVPDFPEGRPVTRDEAEVLLLSRMRERRAEFEEALWQLVRFYSREKRQEQAAGCLAILRSLTDDPEQQAAYWLAHGQTMEQVGDFESAVDFYRRAIGMEPTGPHTWYFAHNNLGYSLVQLGQFEAAEPFCRAAIQIEPLRHNAHKNLGLALQGQGRFPEAAEALARAVQANAADPRALGHLEELLRAHPEVADTNPGMREFLPRGREAVAIATGLAEVAMRERRARGAALTPAEKILVAVHRLVFLEDAARFSAEDVARAVGVSAKEWKEAFAPVFLAMLEGATSSARRVDEKHRGLFEPARDGAHGLTPRGHEVVRRIHEL